MSVVYIDRTIDCTKDNSKCEKVTGYEHGVKVFRFKPLNGNNEVNESVEIPKNIVDSGIFIEQEQ